MKTKRARSRRPLIVAGLVFATVGAWLLWRSAPSRETPREQALPGPQVDASAPLAAARDIGVEVVVSPLAAELHAPGRDEAGDVAALRGLLGQFTTTLRPAERPPLGDNADIAAALTGRNRRRLAFLPFGHPALRDGLLVDRRGTPYHFHARSADAIDVRSAGPDRVLFTADDQVSGSGGR